MPLPGFSLLSLDLLLMVEANGVDMDQNGEDNSGITAVAEPLHFRNIRKLLDLEPFLRHVQQLCSQPISPLPR